MNSARERSDDQRQPVTLCLVNNNGEVHLPLTLPSIESVLSDFNEVLILDNASTDRSPELIQAALPGVTCPPETDPAVELVFC